MPEKSFRLRKWIKRTSPELVDQAYRASREVQLDLGGTAQLEHETTILKVKNMIDGKITNPAQKPMYISYAQAIPHILKKYSGVLAAKEVASHAMKWSSRGLDTNLLISIAKSFGVDPSPFMAAGAPGKGPPFFVIAAADTPPFLRERADTICDGVSDQEEINSAFSFAPTVYLCPGTYVIDGSIVMPSHTRLMGAGPSSVIKLKDNYNADIYMIQNSDPTNGNTDITISNLTIDGNWQNQAEGYIAGIYLCNVTSSKVESCTLKNTNGAAIYVENSEELELLENTFLEDFLILWAEKSNHLTISRNTCASFGDGFLLSDCHNCVVSENSFKMGWYEAIWIFGTEYAATHNVISGNRCLNSGYCGIAIDFSSYSVVSENICANTLYDGILIYYSENNAVIGNCCENNAFAGIHAEHAINNLIIGNHCYKNTLYGIYLKKSSYNLISGNIIRSGGVTGYGICIDGSECVLNVIEGNNLYQSGTSGDILDSGTDTRRRDNIGNDGSWLEDA
ncbi:MAG: right-handed parallel beta-helix repeat-containing protein [Nitrososphaerota archaeon]